MKMPWGDATVGASRLYFFDVGLVCDGPTEEQHSINGRLQTITLSDERVISYEEYKIKQAVPLVTPFWSGLYRESNNVLL